MRKPSSRFQRKVGNVFLVEARPDLFALGVMHDDGYITFSRHFFASPQVGIDIALFEDKLFSASVQVSFFRNSNIYPVSKMSPSELEAIPVSQQVIRPKNRPFDPENPFGHDGPFPYSGGDLVQVRNPLTPESSSDATILKSGLNCETDADIILSTEISALYVNHDLKERLVACYLSGRNVDAFKARTFDDCAVLLNEHVLKTHWYMPKRMPLLGLALNEAKNSWEPAS